MYYTGIGSREAPPDILNEMSRLAGKLAPHFILRSGGADGADSAFESGAYHAGGGMEIYLPWKEFNGRTSNLYGVCGRALNLASKMHPAWLNLKQPARLLHARNCYQVLGQTLDLPSSFVVAWTPDGCESERERSSETGGTGTAIVLADRNGVPVFNLARQGSRARLRAFLAEMAATA